MKKKGNEENFEELEGMQGQIRWIFDLFLKQAELLEEYVSAGLLSADVAGKIMEGVMLKALSDVELFELYSPAQGYNDFRFNYKREGEEV